MNTIFYSGHVLRECSSARESACQRERERVRDRERERERRGKMSVLFTYLCPYSMYCVYMYISCTPYQTIIREEGREREREREKERERECV